jgi:hypothetical protein
MLRQQNYLQTGKYPQITHVHSSRKHLIFRSYEKRWVETYLTKRVRVKDESMMVYYQYHIYNHVLPYIQRQLHGDEATLLRTPPRKAEVMIQGISENDMVDEYDYSGSEDDRVAVKESDGSTLFLTKKMIHGKSLR